MVLRGPAKRLVGLFNEERMGRVDLLSLTREELERKAGMEKGSLPKGVEEEIIAGAARMAASGNGISRVDVNRIIASTLERYGEKAAFPLPMGEDELSQLLQVTVSLGVSVFRGNRREFFNAADRALYQSKSEGKNRICYAAS